MGSWPQDVGILAMELVFPSQFVDQRELEQFDGVSEGKYTIGLGQRRMGFCNDREDINSICLTVVQKLMENCKIKPSEIGRLEVGTETIIDKSKSVKTVLMQLFEPFGVNDIEGLDTTNACYGGTAALFNSIAWVESSAWNGRYALVVTADIAVYAKGSARPTGGAGAVAMLIGPNAPLVFDRGIRSTYMKHAYDFYKPDLTSEYPVVDGKLSIQCYLNALDQCYQQYCKNVSKKLNNQVDVNYFDAVIFHSPFCKLVQKSVARLTLNDYVQASEQKKAQKFSELVHFKDIKMEENYFDRDIEKAFMNYSKQIFADKTSPSLFIANQVGNMYTSSLYGGLVSLLINKTPSELAGKKIAMFSYGSGLAASLFSITVTENCGPSSPLHKLISNLSHVKPLLELREKIKPQIFESTLELRQKTCHSAPYQPIGSIKNFFPGTYYLKKVDELHRRFYDRVPVLTNGHA